ncbi:MAG: hypothetical protein KC503_28730 [Myxococcales bacterium]|nr:hypothetical protein [Myxococcales bacterium]
MSSPVLSLTSRARAALAAVCVLALSACAGDPPSGLAKTPDGPGPRVIFDLEIKPLPEIPLPNDLATDFDASSSTGRRLNLPTTTRTRYEQRIREAANRLEGASTYGAISVAFDSPLDLDNLRKRQALFGPVKERAMLLVNIDPNSPDYGKLMPLDIGHGNFPQALHDPGDYWPRDPRSKVPSLLFDTTDEDKNHNGKLDPGEDTDGDGVLDVPNVFPKGGDPVDDLAYYYERVTNTLIARPLMPLDQETRYAVVLTKHLRGSDGNAVHSPWPLVNHTRQSAALAELPEILAQHELSTKDVAFAWTFTTGAVTRDLEALRAGLYGHGPFARLAKEFPPELTTLPGVDDKTAKANAYPTNVHVVPAKVLQDLVKDFGFALGDAAGITASGAGTVADAMNNIAYFVVGTVRGPNLLADRDGHARPGYPADDDEIWDLDRATGFAFYQPQDIPFMCAIPRSDRVSQTRGTKGPPFDVTIYHHGLTSARIEMIGFAGVLARFGVATCTIDAYGHGLALPPEYQTLAVRALKGFGIGPAAEAMLPGRARDLSNTNTLVSGGDFFTADLFHSRDMARQSVLDNLVLVRALRALGTLEPKQDLDGDGKLDQPGDFDGDGTIDLGGPDVTYTAWGTSLGGILSSVTAAVEPKIVAASPQAMGGGLSDVAGRSTHSNVRGAAILPSIGPLLIGQPQPDGSIDLVTIVTSAPKDVSMTLAKGLSVAEGERVVVENQNNGFRASTYAAADGGFRLSVACDAMDHNEKRVRFGLEPDNFKWKPQPVSNTLVLGDALAIKIYAAGADINDPNTKPRLVIDRFGVDVTFQGVIYPTGQPLVALANGLGLGRNTPDFRRTLALAQLALDAADPINYAAYYKRKKLDFSYDPAAKNVGTNMLFIATGGDTTVPVATAVALARASGIVDFEHVDARWGKTPNQVLIDSYALEGLSRLRRYDDKEVVVDVENFSGGTHAPGNPRIDPPMRLSIDHADGGHSGLRIPLIDPKGQHAFLVPNPSADFDNDQFLVHMVARFLSSGGKELSDEPCMATSACSWIPPLAPPHQ